MAKKASGIPTVTHPEAVESALCYGWIDGQRIRFDEHWYIQRFTPRRPRSNWSRINRGKVEQLIKEGRMQPAGLREVERARAAGCWCLLEIDVQGAAQVLERHPGAVVILVVAPSEEEQARRMRLRGDDEAQVASRLELGRQEEEVGRSIAHHVVVNDSVERAVEELAGILQAHRDRPALGT